MARLQDFQTVTPTASDKLLVVQSQGQGLATVGSTLGAKMDKTNPTGTGVLSLNRKADTTVANCSVAVGYNCEASGLRSFACGHNTTASGDYSHTEGIATTASGERSHAEGTSSTASGLYSHAENQNTVASGQAAHAEGYATVASGSYSHAEGNNTIANHLGQHVCGAYNIADTSTAAATARGTYAEIVGIGGSASNRANGRTLDWSGNEVLAGGLTINGNQAVSGIAQLENISGATNKTYTIPTSIYSTTGVYILAFGNNYGVGAIYLLNIRSAGGSPSVLFTPLKTSTYISVESTAANTFKVTTTGESFTVNLTRIA